MSESFVLVPLSRKMSSALTAYCVLRTAYHSLLAAYYLRACIHCLSMTLCSGLSDDHNASSSRYSRATLSPPAARRYAAYVLSFAAPG